MPIPALIPTGVGSGVTGSTQSASEPFDVSLGGYRFMLAASPENPMIRRGAAYRSDQINFTGDPGEQALGFWWQRSQDTWHYGAGAPTFDGVGSGDPSIALGRYADSYGIDPWTAGEIKLLRDTDRISSLINDDTAGLDLVVAADAVTGEEFLYWGDGENLCQWDGESLVEADLGWGGILSVASDGVNLYLVDDDGEVWAVTPSGVEHLYTGVTGSQARIHWAKQRLILTVDNRIYELATDATNDPLPTALFEHTNANWVWLDVEGGPGAIYACGFAGTSSAVFKFVLDTDGVLPTLTAGITACEMPDGETALSMKSYLQLFIGIGTTAGLRVCQFQDTDIILSPLTIEGAGRCAGITGFDRFLYATVEDAGQGFAGLARVDLSAEVAPGKYAWAKDARANTDAFSFSGVTGVGLACTMFLGQPAFSVHTDAVYTVSSDRYVESGLLTSGRILFGMADFKIFQRASFTTGGQGLVALSTGVDSATASVPRVSINTTVQDRIEVDIGSQRGSTLTVGLQLTRGDLNKTPTVLSMSLKALPSQPREEQWIVPLRLYAVVENQFGEPQYQSVIDVLDEISDLVRYQRPTVYQTYFGRPEDWRTWVVQVEDFEFRQLTAEGDWGGVLTVSLRSVRGE
jgi:hypothetical protein